MATSLISSILSTFSRFQQMAGRLGQASVARVWLQLLGESSEPNERFFQGLSLITTGLINLSEQIDVSSSLDAESKKYARGIITGLQVLVIPDNIANPAESFKHLYSSDKLQTLAMVRIPLTLENPEPQLSEDQAKQLDEQLATLISEIEASELDGRLKSMLLRHATFMLWALKNIDMFGTGQLYDQIALAMVATHKAEISVPAQSQSAWSRAKESVFKYGKNAMKILDAAAQADRAFHTGQQIYHDAEPIIQAIVHLPK
jgi:hypothetical protein